MKNFENRKIVLFDFSKWSEKLGKLEIKLTMVTFNLYISKDVLSNDPFAQSIFSVDVTFDCGCYYTTECLNAFGLFSSKKNIFLHSKNNSGLINELVSILQIYNGERVSEVDFNKIEKVIQKTETVLLKRFKDEIKDEYSCEKILKNTVNFSKGFKNYKKANKQRINERILVLEVFEHLELLGGEQLLELSNLKKFRDDYMFMERNVTIVEPDKLIKMIKDSYSNYEDINDWVICGLPVFDFIDWKKVQKEIVRTEGICKKVNYLGKDYYLVRFRYSDNDY